MGLILKSHALIMIILALLTLKIGLRDLCDLNRSFFRTAIILVISAILFAQAATTLGL